MEIGVLSDSHDNLDNLLIVLEILRQRRVETVIHCGDLTDFTMISHFSGFRLIYLIGNMDVAIGTIRKLVEQMREDNFAGLVYQGKLDGRMVAATHSHLEGKVMELVQEKRFDWIFHGHTHEKRDETVRGTRIVNPGALGGLVRGPRSFCVVDLTAGEVEFIELKSSRR